MQFFTFQTYGTGNVHLVKKLKAYFIDDNDSQNQVISFFCIDDDIYNKENKSNFSSRSSSTSFETIYIVRKKKKNATIPKNYIFQSLN